MIVKFYWTFVDFIRDLIIKWKTRRMPMEIEYSWLLHGYLHPMIRDFAPFDVELICEALAHVGLCYGFLVNGVDWHEHEFRSVIEDAYNYGETFLIPPQYEHHYSEQELLFLRAVAARGAQDRKEASNANA